MSILHYLKNYANRKKESELSRENKLEYLKEHHPKLHTSHTKALNKKYIAEILLIYSCLGAAIPFTLGWFSYQNAQVTEQQETLQHTRTVAVNETLRTYLNKLDTHNATGTPMLSKEGQRTTSNNVAHLRNEALRVAGQYYLQTDRERYDSEIYAEFVDNVEKVAIYDKQFLNDLKVTNKDSISIEYRSFIDTYGITTTPIQIIQDYDKDFRKYATALTQATQAEDASGMKNAYRHLTNILDELENIENTGGRDIVRYTNERNRTVAQLIAHAENQTDIQLADSSSRLSTPSPYAGGR